MAGITLHDLSFQYDGQPVLRGLNWQLPAGEHGVLLGASGSGKSTLLMLIAGLLKPTGGAITLGDTRLSALSTAEVDRFRGSQIGFLFQRLHLVKEMTVYENLKLAHAFSGKAFDPTHADQLLSELGLEGFGQKPAHTLSVGQAQRVALIRAVIHQPRYLLADEPTSALDDVQAERLVALLTQQAKAIGATLLIATHDTRIVPHFEHRFHL